MEGRGGAARRGEEGGDGRAGVRAGGGGGFPSPFDRRSDGRSFFG